MIESLQQEQWLVFDDHERRPKMRKKLENAEIYWSSLEDFRERRRRSRDYVRGDQWGDLMEDPETGESITEEEYIRKQGKVPMKNNQIRQIVKNMLGQFRENEWDPMAIGRNREEGAFGDMMTNALKYVHDLNHLEELDARDFEEFLLSGFFGQKIGFKWWKERDQDDVVVDRVEPTRFFYNTDARDPRLNDIRFVGEILDVTIDELIATFAHSKSDAKLLQEKFNTLYKGADPSSPTGSDLDDNLSFYYTGQSNKIRIYEIWEVERAWVRMAHDPSDGTWQMTDLSDQEIQQINQHRMQQAQAQGIPIEAVPQITVEERFEEVWKVYFLTHNGDILYEAITPFEHQSNPYALKLYPMIDGEVWGLVEDVIDQQRYINRMITMLDFVLGSGAKGVLMVPENAIPEDSSADEFASEWTKFNGVIVYDADNQNKNVPKQVTSNSTNVGATQMLQLQMQLMKEISGVTGAIQGQEPQSGTPASLYEQQTMNASLSNKDIFESFFNGLKQRDYKIVKTIQQYYDDKRYINVAGSGAGGAKRSMYDPKKAKTLEYDIVIGQGTNTTAYRQMLDGYLLKFLEGGLIDLPMFLENSSLPFADQLLQTIQTKQQEMQQAQAQGMGGENPQAQQLINQMMSGQQGGGGMPQGGQQPSPQGGQPAGAMPQGIQADDIIQ